MTVLDEGPSLLACMAAAVEGHNAMRKQALAPQPERPGQIAIRKLLSGDVRGARRVMEEIERRSELSKYDPSQARDQRGRWSGSSSSSSSGSGSDHALDDAAGRIANLTTSMETATAGLCAEATSPDDRDRHARALVAATAQLNKEIAGLPDDVDQFSAASRSALAGAHRQLTRTREQLRLCGALGKGLIDDDYQQAHQTVARHLADERERAQTLGKSVTLLKREEHPMRSFDLDRLESEADSLIRKITHALGEDDDGVDDDGNGYDDVSNPSMHADDDSDAPDDDEDDYDLSINKATDKEIFFEDRHRNMAPLPVDRTYPPDPYRTDLQQAAQRPNKHKFETVTDRIRERDGCSKTEALVRARQENPTLYRDYQQHLADESTQQQQHTRRAGYGVGKRAPDNFESLVGEEMVRAGVTEEIAKQRVVQKFGAGILKNRMFAKSADNRIALARFQKRVEALMYDEGITDRTEAMRQIRKRHPALYSALQVV
jgi:hypothetical protein